MKSVLFFNFSDKEFTHKFDGCEYTFAPFQQIYLEDFKAEHFAKHLIDRELDRVKKPIFSPERVELMSKCLPSAIQENTKNVEEVVELKLNEEVEKKRFCEFCTSKGVKHLKNCPTLKKLEEPEFEDLNK